MVIIIYSLPIWTVILVPTPKVSMLEMFHCIFILSSFRDSHALSVYHLQYDKWSMKAPQLTECERLVFQLYTQTHTHTHTQTPSPSPTSPLSLQVPFSKRRYFCGLHAILRWSGVHLHTQEPGEDTNSRGATVCATGRGRPKHPFPWGGADTAEDNAPPGWEGEEGKWEEEKEHLLHACISGYQGVNIIRTEHWTHSWLNNVQKYLLFCSKNCGPILITLWSCEKRYQALSTHTCSRSVITLEQRGRMQRTRIPNNISPITFLDQLANFNACQNNQLYSTSWSREKRYQALPCIHFPVPEKTWERGYGKTDEILVSSEHDVIVKFSKLTRNTLK